MLEWEIQWILNNPERYSSALHQQAVIGNIAKRYTIKGLERTLKRVTDKLNSISKQD